MREAVIVSTARTPIGKAYRGAFNATHGATMGAHVLQHAVQRAGIDPGEVEEIIMGVGRPEGATGGNIARQSALKAGFPVGSTGLVVSRACGSGLQAIAVAAQRVIIQSRSNSSIIAFPVLFTLNLLISSRICWSNIPTSLPVFYLESMSLLSLLIIQSRSNCSIIAFPVLFTLNLLISSYNC